MRNFSWWIFFRRKRDYTRALRVFYIALFHAWLLYKLTVPYDRSQVKTLGKCVENYIATVSRYLRLNSVWLNDSFAEAILHKFSTALFRVAQIRFIRLKQIMFRSITRYNSVAFISTSPPHFIKANWTRCCFATTVQYSIYTPLCAIRMPI